jgi:hypothetical protein
LDNSVCFLVFGLAIFGIVLGLEHLCCHGAYVVGALGKRITVRWRADRRQTKQEVVLHIPTVQLPSHEQATLLLYGRNSVFLHYNVKRRAGQSRTPSPRQSCEAATHYNKPRLMFT